MSRGNFTPVLPSGSEESSTGLSLLATYVSLLEGLFDRLLESVGAPFSFSRAGICPPHYFIFGGDALECIQNSRHDLFC